MGRWGRTGGMKSRLFSDRQGWGMVSQGSKCQSAGLGPPTQMIAAFVHLADLCGHYNNKKRGLQPNGPRATIARDAFLLPSGPCGCGIELVSFKADGGWPSRGFFCDSFLPGTMVVFHLKSTHDCCTHGRDGYRNTPNCKEIQICPLLFSHIHFK